MSSKMLIAFMLLQTLIISQMSRAEDVSLEKGHPVYGDDHFEAEDQPTQDICAILCSIQLGGDACDCNLPSLPGK